MIEPQNQRPPIELPLPTEPVSQKTQSCCIALGGISLGLITALVLGIIFGPLAALTGFCGGAISGALFGLIIDACCIKAESHPDLNNLTLQQKIDRLNEHHIARREKLENMRNI